MKKQHSPVKLFSVFVVCSIALVLFNRPATTALQPNRLHHLPPPGGSALILQPSIDIPAIVDELDLGVPAGNGHRPQRVAVDSRRGQLYTLNEGLVELKEGNTLSIVDLITNQVTALLPLDNLPAPVSFLDERPERQNWTMIGCERSLQFHRHFYGDEPSRVEMCPRKIAGTRTEPTLLKCCLLEYHVEQDGPIAVVPWGADLAMVESALRTLAAEVEYA